MKSRPLAILSAVFLGLASGAQAAQAPQPSQPPAEKPPVKKTSTTQTATDFTLGLGFHGVTRLTGSATFMWGKPKMLVAYAPAMLVQVRAGARGGQVGLGFVTGVFEDSPVRPSGIGATLKAVAIRTWRDPSGLTDGHTYAGIESDIILLGFRGSVGYARKVKGQGGPDGRFVWSLGLGL